MASSKSSVLIGSLLHETNTFAQSRTSRDDIKGDREYYGKSLLSGFEGTETEVGGAIEVATRHEINLIPAVGAELMPGGLVEDQLYEEYITELTDVANAHRNELDGIFLALHGAMVTESLTDPEGELLRRLREIVGPDVPIVVTLDLHAQVSDTMVEMADALIAYETYPHTDMGDTGRKGMELLRKAIAGTIDPVTVIERPPVLAWAPEQNTLDGPMSEIMSASRQLEERTDILKTNIMPGFLSSDIPEMGFSVPVVADNNPSAGTAVARELAETIWDRRNDLQGGYPDAKQAVELAADYVESGATDSGPVVLADSGDNPGSGAPADGTIVLRELLDRDIPNTEVALIYDPAVVETCLEAGVGSSVTVTLGGKTDDLHGEPIADLDGYVRAITDGRFTNQGKMAQGVMNDVGTAVHLECGPNRNISVIVTDERLQPYDTEIWRHIGIQPERQNILLVKSKNHFRADYEPIASEVILVNTPGLGAVDPNRFNFTEINRPVFPLDEMAEDVYPNW